MYSKSVEAALKKARAHEGSRILVKNGKSSFEGVLLPRIEYGSANAITLKLDSGYNVGIEFDSKTTIYSVKSSKVSIQRKEEKHSFKKLP